MEFDEILEHIGDIGAYQIILFFMLGAWEFMTADVVAMNFIAGYQDHHCRIPALESNFSFEQQKFISIPCETYADDGINCEKYDQCRKYDLNFDSYDISDFYNWTRDMINSTNKIKCGDDGWLFDRSQLVDTIRSDFDLVCDQSFKGELVSSVYMIGILIGAMVGGLASDAIGRKWAFIGSHCIKMVGNFMATFAPSYWVFLLGRFITGAGGMGAGVAVYVLISEFTLSKWRCILGVLWFTIWSLTYAVMPGIAYYLRDWQPLMAVYTYPLIIFLVYIPFLDESPRWLISKGRHAKARTIIDKMADINGTTDRLPQNYQLYGETAKEIEVKAEIDMAAPESSVRQGNFFDLFKTPNLLRKTLIIYLCWFTNNLIYYGLSLNSGSLSGNVYLNTFWLGVIEIPANILCFVFSNWIGRTWTIGISLLIAAGASAIQIPLILVGDMPDAVTALSIIGKAGVTSSFSGIYVLTSEVFPTVVRNVGLGSSSMCARISGIMAPYMGEPMIKVWAPLPSVIFGAFATLSGVLTLTLPETLGKPLPETIEQAENFGKKGVAIEENPTDDHFEMVKNVPTVPGNMNEEGVNIQNETTDPVNTKEDNAAGKSNEAFQDESIHL